jgi:hypothetical protein
LAASFVIELWKFESPFLLFLIETNKIIHFFREKSSKIPPAKPVAIARESDYYRSGKVKK